MIVEPYRPADQAEWDAFVEASRNGTFLLRRGYMDYHRDRFEDHSLLVRRAGGELCAVLPANRRDDELHSHGGLTYGGLVWGDGMGLRGLMDAFEAVRAYAREAGFRRLLYKTIPPIHHRQPAEEDRYALFRAGARLVRRDAWAVLPLPAALPMDSQRRRGLGRAHRSGLEVRDCDDWEAFWRILEGVLAERHQVRPVHTLAEITSLVGRFPEHIRLVGSFAAGELVAGTVLYCTPRVVHAQYIASGERGRQCGALDLLFTTLFAQERSRAFFSLGCCTEQEGRVLNEGLMGFKEGFGARTMAHDFYALDL